MAVIIFYSLVILLCFYAFITKVTGPIWFKFFGFVLLKLGGLFCILYSGIQLFKIFGLL